MMWRKKDEPVCILKFFLSVIRMPMCASDCNCRWCRLSDMSHHLLFKERIDALLLEYERTVSPKPRAEMLLDDCF